jgi:hypothetical protein
MRAVSPGGPEPRERGHERGWALFERLVGLCDAKPVPPRAWLAPETPLTLLAAIAVLAPFMASGAIRAVTHLGLGVALLPGTLVTLLACATLRPHWAAKSAAASEGQRVRLACGTSVAILVAAWSVQLLYVPAFDGMPILNAWDAGTHVALRNRFVWSKPDEYAGFVSFYALTSFFERIARTNPFRSFEVAVYASVAAFMAVPMVIASAAVSRAAASRRAYALGFIAATVTWIFCARRFGLPLIHSIQADGFFPHVFGFLPLGFVWMADALVVPLLLRLFWVGLGLLACRFTYGLNLADLLATLALLLAADSLRARWRILPLVGAAGAAGAAWIAYQKLLPLFGLAGYVEVYDVARLRAIVLRGAAIVASYAAAAWMTGTRRLPRDNLLQAIRLPVVFATFSAVAVGKFLLRSGQHYYAIKYPLLPFVLLLAAASVAVGHAAAKLCAAGPLRPSAVVAIGLLAALSAMADDPDQLFSQLQRTFEERATGRPPFVSLRPLADLEAWSRITGVLRQRRSAFGGYVSSNFYLAHFMNASLGHGTYLQEFVPPDETPGHCVFWVDKHDDLYTTPDVPKREGLEPARQALARDPAGQCAKYAVAWSPRPRSLCFRCY